MLFGIGCSQFGEGEKTNAQFPLEADLSSLFLVLHTN
jgi:hypothetical protein